jgi:hypothetical protein
VEVRVRAEPAARRRLAGYDRPVISRCRRATERTIQPSGDPLLLVGTGASRSTRWRRADLRAAGGRRLAALGIGCWFARRTPSTAAGLGVARAFLAYNVVACGVLFEAYPPLPSGLLALSGCSAWPAGNRPAGGIVRAARASRQWLTVELRRARAHGQQLGRPKVRVPVERLQTVAGLSVDDAARMLGVSRSTLKRWRRQVKDFSTACRIIGSRNERLTPKGADDDRHPQCVPPEVREGA